MSVFRFTTAAHDVPAHEPVEVGKYSPPMILFVIPVGIIFAVMTYFFSI